MIRINLVGERKRAVAAAPSRFAGLGGGGGRPLGNTLLVVVSVLGLLVAGGHLFLKIREVKDMKAQVAEAEREAKELEQYIREVEQFKAKKAELERKVQVINTLKANQKGPVLILDYVSRALPELLWLTKLEVRGKTLLIDGQALNTNAVANFIENLDRVEEFAEPVLKSANQDNRGEAYAFQMTVDFNFAPPPPESAEGELAEPVAGGS